MKNNRRIFNQSEKNPGIPFFDSVCLSFYASIFALFIIVSYSFAAEVVKTNIVENVDTNSGPNTESNWPQFLGPEGNGRIPDTCSIPLHWSETEHIAWKTPIPGRGWSSPVISGNRIWLTTASEDGKEKSAVCLDKTTGVIVHQINLVKEESPQFVNAINSHASPSCAVDAERVYVHFGYAGTFCLDAQTGNTLWERRDLACEHLMGAGSSPILYKNSVIFHVDGADTQYIVALDRKTGKTVWKTDRSADLASLKPDNRKAYSTPVLAKRSDGKTLLLSAASQAGYAYDPDTGKEIWKYFYPGGYSNAAKPVVWKDRVVWNSGFDRPALFCVPLDLSETVSDENLFWECKKNISPVPTPIEVGDHLYVVSATGVGSCIDMKTGDALWTERFGGGFWASPLYTKDRVYFFDDTGKTIVVKVEPKQCEILATNELESGCMGTPAVSGNALFLRTKTHLYRIE